jgi:hypothetical protein
MKEKITIILFFLITTSFSSFGQETKIETFNYKCDSDNQLIWDSISFEKQDVLYKVISRKELYTKGAFTFYESEILLPDFGSSSDKEFITRLLTEIRKSHFTNEFTAYKDCKVREIYYQGLRPTKKQVKYIERNLIGHFKILNEENK